jgi:Mrp family chromosome partitioning ATPase
MNTDSGTTIATTDAAVSLPAATVAAPPTRIDSRPNLDLWRLIQRALRGRYPLALTLATAGGFAGAWAGLNLGQRLYRADGLVRIASVVPQVMQETDQNRSIPMFDGYIQAQQQVMTSAQTVHAAMRESAWQNLGSTAKSPEQFAASLQVEVRPKSDHLRVRFIDADPQVASAGVRAIIAAYQSAYDREQNQLDRLRISELELRRSTQRYELDQTDTLLAAIVEEYGTVEVEPLYKACTQRVQKLHAALADAERAIAMAPHSDPQRAVPGTIADIAMADPAMRVYVTEQARQKTELQQALARGYGPDHPLRLQLQKLLEESDARVEHRVQEYNASRAASVPRDRPQSARMLRQQQANLTRLAEAADAELDRLSEGCSRVRTLQARAGELRRDLDKTNERLEVLKTESALGSRLTVVSGSDAPLTVLLNNRPKAAAVGAVGGMMASLAAITLLGLKRRRYRHCKDVSDDFVATMPFIAMLPEAANKSLSAVAAQCLHRLRIQLQPDSNSAVYLVTGAASGSGSSSVSLALALSFAGAGYRTLLVDSDFAKRGLTLAFGLEGAVGFREAIAGDDVVEVAETTRTGLSIITCKDGSQDEISTLSQQSVRRFVAHCRTRFDVVLIDGGAITESIGASVLARETDGIIFTLARDQEQATTMRAIRQMELVAGRWSGMVFNRAEPTDFCRATGHVLSPSQSQGRNLSGRLTRFGPLVTAMLSSLNHSSQDDMDLLPKKFIATQADSINGSIAGYGRLRQAA